MSINITDQLDFNVGFSTQERVSIDKTWGPYNSIGSALSAIPKQTSYLDRNLINRYIGLTVGIYTFNGEVLEEDPIDTSNPDGIKEYWWNHDIEDTGLIAKNSGGGGSYDITTEITETSTNDEVPSAKAVYTFVTNLIEEITTALSEI